LFANDSQTLVSASEDKTIRFWDKDSKQEIKKLDFNTIPYSIELSRDSKLLSICHGNYVMFLDMESMETVKEFKIPTQVLSATLHPDKSVFVCGGEDFKMYKYDYNNGNEIGLRSLFLVSFGTQLFCLVFRVIQRTLRRRSLRPILARRRTLRQR
jgi:serine-threonine kinase receptor-associated protein